MTSERFRQPTYQVRKKVLKLFGGSLDVYGPDGSLVLFASQKAFKLKEDIRLYSDKEKVEELLVIKARSIIDFSAAYDVEDPASGQKLGAFKRKGWSSLLRDQWIVMDASDQEVGYLKEDSAVMAALRRFISFISQTYQCEVNGAFACTYKQNFNPFVYKLNINFPEVSSGFDKRMALAGAVLLSAIEGKQSGSGFNLGGLGRLRLALRRLQADRLRACSGSAAADQLGAQEAGGIRRAAHGRAGRAGLFGVGLDGDQRRAWLRQQAGEPLGQHGGVR